MDSGFWLHALGALCGLCGSFPSRRSPFALRLSALLCPLAFALEIWLLALGCCSGFVLRFGFETGKAARSANDSFSRPASDRFTVSFGRTETHAETAPLSGTETGIGRATESGIGRTTGIAKSRLTANHQARADAGVKPSRGHRGQNGTFQLSSGRPKT